MWPLALVDVYYEPLGPLPRPKGQPRSGGPDGSNLMWLRAGDEADLVESLAEVGLIVVSVADDWRADDNRAAARNAPS